MANITLTSPIFYKNGQSGVSAVVGYESLSNRVVRYTLRTGETGASCVHLAFSGNWQGNGTVPTLRFYIGTDPDSHADAGRNAPYTGTLSRSGYTYTGTAEQMLLPDRDYYVWVFPATEVFGWVQWSYAPGAAVADVSGGALTQLRADPGLLGSPMTLHLTVYGDFTHTVTCTLGSRTLTVAENTGETVLTFTPPLALAEESPNSAQTTAVFSVTSLRDGQSVGTMQTPVTLTVPDSVVPTVSAQWLDLSGAYDRFGTCVQLVSRLGVEASAQGVLGSSIVSTALTLDGRAYNGGQLLQPGEHSLCVTVTDSRGRTGVSTHILSVAEYAVPWVQVDASRCDADGTPNEMGEFARLTFTGQTHQVAGRNEAVLTFAYGETTETVAVAVGSLLERRIVPADSTVTLPLWAELADSLTVSPRAAMTLSIGYATVDFYGGGRGIAFGTTATRDGFTCAMDTDFCGHAVTGLPEPAADDAAATKRYVDSIVSAIGEKEPRYQYAQKANLTDGYFWWYDGGTALPYKYKYANYTTLEPVTLPAGTYCLSSVSFSYSHIVSASGVVTRIDAYEPTATATSGTFVLTLTESSTLYLGYYNPKSGTAYTPTQVTDCTPYIISGDKPLSAGEYFEGEENVGLENLFNYDCFVEAYIKDCALVANELDVTGASQGHYTGVKMEGNVEKLMCKARFAPHGSLALITTKRGSATVGDITLGSIHLVFELWGCSVGVFDVADKLREINYFSYTITEGEEVSLGFSLHEATNTLTVYLPDGTTRTVTDSTFSTLNGSYAIWEHYCNTSVAGFVCSKFTKLWCKDTAGTILDDNLKRFDGAIGVSPTGQTYRQFTSHNSNNRDFK